MLKSGDALRDRIAQLLGIKFQNVLVEKRLETTTADVFFIDDTNPIFPRSIAIEAKDWKSKLSSEDIATIYNLYAPSLTNRTIDYLWIIGKQPLSGSPRDSLTPNANLARGLIVNFLTSISAHGLKALDQSGQPIKIFRVDTEGFRTEILSRCIFASQKQLVVDIIELQNVVQLSARGTIYLSIPLVSERYNKNVIVKMDSAMSALDKRFATLVRRLIGTNNETHRWIPVELLGDAAERFL
jgi:hypothetical protein